MNKKIILFDWDDTLFSKAEYKKNLRGNLARICEVSEKEIYKHEEEYFHKLKKSGDFHLYNFVEIFRQKFRKNIELDDFKTDKLGIYSRALYPETISVLEKLKNDFNMGIYSQGFDDFQRIKIKSSGIESFFDEELIYISRNKIDPEFIEKLPNGAIIIDDKKEVIEKLQSFNKFKLFWLNRKDDQKIDGVKTIKSLLEITE